jgi:branched-chain amino acid transport system permease protein
MLRRPTVRPLPLAALLLFALLPLPLQNSEFAYVIRLVGVVGLYITIALGLNLVVGLLGLLDLGFMAFYAIGAYTMSLLSMKGVPFWLAMPASMMIAMAVRAALGAPVLRLRGDYLAIVTLGFGEIARIVFNNWDSVTNGPKGLSLLTDADVKPVRLFHWVVDTNIDYYYLILLTVIVCIVVSERLKNSRIGRAWMAIREDETAARLTGIQITRMKMIGFVISAAFAGAAGAIFARWESFVTPESFTFWESVMLVAMVVIGGMGSVPGTVMGVAIVMLAPEVLRNVLGPALVSWRYLLFGAALILVAVYRPQGLWPSRRLSRVTDAEEAGK